MSGRMSVGRLIDEYFDGGKDFEGLTISEIEQMIKDFAINNDLPMGWGFFNNSFSGGAKYTASLLNDRGIFYEDDMGIGASRIRNTRRGNSSASMGNGGNGFASGASNAFWDSVKDGISSAGGSFSQRSRQSSSRSRNERSFNLGALLGSPLLLVIAVLAGLVFIYEMFGAKGIAWTFAILAARGIVRGKKKEGGISLGALLGSPLFWAIAIIAGLIFIYQTFGAAVYSLIIGIKLRKVISLAFVVLATVGIVRGKNMGWPIYIKALVIFMIWLAMFSI